MCGWIFFYSVVVDSYESLRVLIGINIVYNLPISDLNGGTEDRMYHQQAWDRGAAKIRGSGQYTGGKGKGCSSEGHQESGEMKQQKPHEVQQQLRPAWDRKSLCGSAG